MQSSPFETADRFSRRRARLATASGTIFMISMGGSFHGDPASRAGAVQLTAWIVWALLLLVFLAWGGGLFRSREVRALLNDESTRAHRSKAMVLGFWGAIGGALLVYAASFFEPMTAREGVRAVITISVAMTLLYFGSLERRALGDG
jgi:hypothetical protein